ncbi:MAG: low molecular weight protein-tyrosine-phosphatase [Erysipelotrichaceae bacterium]|nr:low molecular weight protein-tyrosine-phosphatase [Erysipelotrichaceae bacterium]
MRKVLFVCHGNICRSVMAEYIFKYKTKDIEGYYASSRAVSYEEEGNDIYPPAKRCLDSHKIPYNRHYASRISQKDYEEYDDIFVMDSSNIYLINKIIDDHNHKIKKLCSYDIDDPWYTGDFEGVYKQICEGIDNYLKKY